MSFTHPHVPHDFRERRDAHDTPADLSQFWVILVNSNPARYKRRNELFFRAREMCELAGVNVISVELAFGARPFMVTEGGHKHHLQLRTMGEELWHKENLINLGIRHAHHLAPNGVREIAWVDADCRPAMPYRAWFEETWHQLQTYQIVQMWEWLIDLDVHHNPIGNPNRGFMANYVTTGAPNVLRERKLVIPGGPEYSGGDKSTTEILSWGAPGLAWAANADALSHLGGGSGGPLMDFSVLGANDWYTAHSLIGNVTANKFDWVGKRYLERIFHYQTLCERWIKRDVGYVAGIVCHDFHGHKAKRGYTTRGKILVDCDYNPDTDLKYDSQGVLHLETWEPRQLELRDRIRAYMRQRDEDGR